MHHKFTIRVFRERLHPQTATAYSLCLWLVAKYILLKFPGTCCFRVYRGLSQHGWCCFQFFGELLGYFRRALRVSILGTPTFLKGRNTYAYISSRGYTLQVRFATRIRYDVINCAGNCVNTIARDRYIRCPRDTTIRIFRVFSRFSEWLFSVIILLN